MLLPNLLLGAKYGIQWVLLLKEALIGLGAVFACFIGYLFICNLLLLKVFVFGFFFAGLGCQISLCGSLRSIMSAPVEGGQSVRLAALPLKRLLEIYILLFECVCLSSGRERNREIAEDQCSSGDFLYHNRVCEF